MSGATAALAAAAFAYFVFGPLADERTTQLTGTPAAAHGSVGETPAIVARGPN